MATMFGALSPTRSTNLSWRFSSLSWLRSSIPARMTSQNAKLQTTVLSCLHDPLFVGVHISPSKTVPAGSSRDAICSRRLSGMAIGLRSRVHNWFDPLTIRIARKPSKFGFENPVLEPSLLEKVFRDPNWFHYVHPPFSCCHDFIYSFRFLIYVLEYK